MVRRFRQPRPSIVLAVLQLVLGLGAAADLVVCREAGGAVAVESVLAGDCCPDHDTLPLAALDPSADPCDCVDTPLLANAVDRRLPLAPLAAPSPVGMAPRLAAPRPACASFLDHRTRPAPSGTARRTVVLLV
jgi:hypothetical protein